MTVQNIRPKEAFQKMKEGYSYLDVRTKEEFENGHPKGATNIPIFVMGPAGRMPNPKFAEAVKEKFPKATKLVIGCHSGGRSAKACELLQAQGYVDCFNIDGGFGGRTDPATGETIAGWQEEGLPCE